MGLCCGRLPGGRLGVSLLLDHLSSHLTGLRAGEHHRPEGRAHAGCALNLGDLHTSDDHARHHLTGEVHNRILRSVHVQALHPWGGLDHSVGHQPLHPERPHRSVVAAGGNNNLGLQHVGVHARLRVVVLRDQGPVGHHTRHPVLTHDEVLHGGCVEQLHVGGGEHLGHNGGGEVRSVLNHDVVPPVLVVHTHVVQELVRGLPDNHRGEELPTKPRTTPGCDGLLDEANADVRVLRELISGAEPRAPAARDDNVALREIVQVLHVPSGHLPAHCRLPDRLEQTLLSSRCATSLHHPAPQRTREHPTHHFPCFGLWIRNARKAR
eukprot:Hpha_TRINITY_DN15549_c4_g1::TRINITY_DN15549_c4_g1_i2::g.107193::m.107193